MRQSLMAGAANFAHLLGRAAPKAAKEDDKDAPCCAENDDLDEEKGDGDDEGDGPNDGKGKKARRAKAEDPEREEEDDDREEREDEEEDDDKKAKGKRAKAEGDDDDEEGDDGSDGADMRKRGARSARLRERARCAAIFADAAAGKNPALAAQLAFATDLPRTKAVSVLRAGGLTASRRPSLDERMAGVKVPAIGSGDAAAPTGASSLAAKIIAAGKKRRGEI